MIKPEKWKWYGSPLHFIGAPHCRWHLATKVGDYLISSVGDYRPSTKTSNNKMERIGLNRFFETMVFKITGHYGCKCPDMDGNELDCAGYQSHQDADAGHLAMCIKWAKKQGRKRNKKMALKSE